jgi:hypothetical protein
MREPQKILVVKCISDKFDYRNKTTHFIIQ